MKIIITILSLFIYSAAFAQPSPTAYVLNTLGEDVSAVNLDNGQVTASAFTAGFFTNQIRIQNDRAYVVNSGDNAIQIVDLSNNNTLNTIDFGSGTNPWAMAFVNDSTAAVSLLYTNQVVFVNLNSGSVLQSVTVGTGPQGLAVQNGNVYVANGGYNGSGYDPGSVSIIDPLSFTVINTVSVGLNPFSLAAGNNGDVIVACAGDYAAVPGQMDVIDGASQTVVHSILPPLPITTVNVSTTNKAFLGTYGSGVLVYDLNMQSYDRDGSAPLSGGPEVAFDNSGNAYIVDFATDSLYVFSPDYNLLTGYLVGDGPISLALYGDTPNAIAGNEDIISRSIRLLPNYPNPFNPATTVRFELDKTAPVRIEVVSINGTVIRTLVNDRLPAGYHELVWDGRTERGISAASGLYFLHLRSKNEFLSQKMHLIR